MSNRLADYCLAPRAAVSPNWGYATYMQLIVAHYVYCHIVLCCVALMGMSCTWICYKP